MSQLIDKVKKTLGKGSTPAVPAEVSAPYATSGPTHEGMKPLAYISSATSAASSAAASAPPSGAPADTDVIIVGAGLSGLAAARRIRELGFTVRVFEASERCGGKMQTGKIDRDAFDFGGCFFDGHGHLNLCKLVTTLSIPTTTVYERGANLLQLGDGSMVRYNPRESVMPSNGLVSSMEVTFALGKIDGMAKTLLPDAPHKAEHGATWDGQTFQSFQSNFVTYPVLSMLNASVRTMYGAEPRDVSLLHVLHGVRTARGLDNYLSMVKGLQHRFVGGCEALIQALVERCGGVSTNSPVTSIQQGRVSTRVVLGTGQVYSSKFVIVATPPHMTSRIEYVPPLPPTHDQVSQRLPQGYSITFIASYRSTFWRESGLSGLALSDVGPVTAIFDYSTSAQPALLIMVAGQKGRELGCEPDANARKRIVLRHVAQFFGDDALQPISFKEKDWAADPWLRGGPCGTPSPGFLSGFADVLRIPFGKVFFAASELSISRPGTMEGAVECGDRIANEVVAQLRNEKSYLPPASAVKSGDDKAPSPSPAPPGPSSPSIAPTSSPVPGPILLSGVPQPGLAGQPTKQLPPPLPFRETNTSVLAPSMSRS